MAKSSSSSSSLVLSLLTVLIVTASLSRRSVEASKGFDLSWAMMTSLTDHEFDMESDISRRFLVDNGSGGAEGAMDPSNTPCKIHGQSYENCKKDADLFERPCVPHNLCKG